MAALVGRGDDDLVDHERAAILAQRHVAGRMALDLGDEDHVAAGSRRHERVLGRRLACQALEGRPSRTAETAAR